MALTLLQLIDRTSGELGLAQPVSVIGSASNQTAQFFALANALGEDLMRDFEWQRLTKIYVFQTTVAVTTTGTTVSASAVITAIPSTSSISAGYVVSGTGIRSYSEVSTVDSSSQVTMNIPATAAGTGVTLKFAKQDYSMPSDYDRMVAGTQWDRTNYWRSRGVRSSQEWAMLQGGVVTIAGTQLSYRLYGNALRLFPAPTAVASLAYEYVSNNWVLLSGGTAPTKASFTLDTDTYTFPDDLMRAGLKYYFLKAKKLDFGVEEEAFNKIKAARQAQDVPESTKSLSRTYGDEVFSPNIPEGNWNL